VIATGGFSLVHRRIGSLKEESIRTAFIELLDGLREVHCARQTLQAGGQQLPLLVPPASGERRRCPSS